MRIVKEIWWIPLAIYMIVIPSFISDRVYDESCKEIEINIHDSSNYRFVTRDIIFSMVHNESDMILGKSLNGVDIENIETKIKSIKELEKVEVYKTANGVLHIDANQRDPIVRIITLYGNSFYLDKHGVIIPHSSNYTPRVPVVSGNIEIPDQSITAGSIEMLPEENMIKRILSLINIIREKELWSGQIEQLWITDDGNIEIVPRVGNHLVKFGTPEKIELKLRNLEALYKEALPELGWNRYKEINLMYEGQIVCKKR